MIETQVFCSARINRVKVFGGFDAGEAGTAFATRGSAGAGFAEGFGARVVLDALAGESGAAAGDFPSVAFAVDEEASIFGEVTEAGVTECVDGCAAGGDAGEIEGDAVVGADSLRR